MPQRDLYHNAVKQALIKDGWAMTHDPYLVLSGGHRGFVNLGTGRTIAAEKEGQKIAVAIKSFVSSSRVADMEQAPGQYLLYRSWMARMEPERRLFLGISQETAIEIFEETAGRVLVEDYALCLLIVNMEREDIVLAFQPPHLRQHTDFAVA
jgi:hypothetical protein